MMGYGKAFRRGLLAAMAGAVLASALVGCGDNGKSAADGGSKKDPKAGAAEKTVFQFWHSMSGEQESVLGELVKNFNAANPDAEVQAVYQGAYNQLLLNLNNAIVAGEPPALAQVYEGWTSRFLENEQLEPVQTFIDAEPDGYKAVLEDFYPGFRDNNTWDGKMITLPFNKSTYVIFYNATWFKEAGYDSFPNTVEGMLEAARKLTGPDASGKKRYGVGARTTLETLSTLMHAYGGRFHEPNDQGAVVAVDTPPARRALTDLAALQKDGAAFMEGDYMSGPFGAGVVGFFWGSSAGLPFVDKAIAGKFDWNLASLPDGSADGSGGVLFQGTNIAIFTDNTDAEKQAAWRFLKFLMEPQNTALWASRTGYLPIRRAALEQESLKKYIAANPKYQIFLDQMDRAVFEPKKAYWDNIRNEIAAEIESALQGRKSPEDALQAAEKKAQRIIREEAN
jgi:multiple sugar transport system substrate-binding protein